MSKSVTRRIPAVLYQKGQPPQSYHAFLSVGATFDEVVIHLESPQVGGDMIVWRVSRNDLRLACEQTLGYSVNQNGFSILRFRPENYRKHGWTHIGPISGEFAADLWNDALDEFLAASSYA